MEQQRQRLPLKEPEADNPLPNSPPARPRGRSRAAGERGHLPRCWMLTGVRGFRWDGEEERLGVAGE